MTTAPDHALFRPPAEAYSLILRVADGCPWNRCTFCGMYKGVRYRAYDPAEIDRLVDGATHSNPRARRVFLADGDAMAMPYNDLHRVLVQLNRNLSRLTRVSVYANGRSILDKTAEQLRELRGLKLHTLYMGLESGEFDVLTEHEAVAEIRECLALLELNGTVFRANHTSNVVPLEGRLPKDRDRLLHELDVLLASDRLDRNTPGHMPMAL